MHKCLFSQTRYILSCFTSTVKFSVLVTSEKNSCNDKKKNAKPTNEFKELIRDHPPFPSGALALPSSLPNG